MIARPCRARRPDNSELTGLLDTLSRRIVRVLERRGLLIADRVDPYLDFAPGSSLDQLQAASITYPIAIGPHTGRKALSLYSVPPLGEMPNNPLLAQVAGVSLHAATVCEAHQRSRLERLCRYIALQGCRVLRRLRTIASALARLAALVPRPRLNLIRFHGVFAPNFEHRARIVPRQPRGRSDSDKPTAPMSWMQRLKWVFAIDIETCPECGGKLRVIACIEDPPLIREILGHFQRRAALTGSISRGPPDSQLVPNLT